MTNRRIGWDFTNRNYCLEVYDPEVRGIAAEKQRAREPDGRAGWWRILWLRFATRAAAEQYIEIHGWPEVTA
jgi:hypothetical protein